MGWKSKVSSLLPAQDLVATSYLCLLYFQKRIKNVIHILHTQLPQLPYVQHSAHQLFRARLHASQLIAKIWSGQSVGSTTVRAVRIVLAFSPSHLPNRLPRAEHVLREKVEVTFNSMWAAPEV